MLRSLSIIVGCLIVAATAHVSIMASGGYSAPTAPLQIAVALGLCTGSVCIGAALGEGRWLLAFMFVLTLLSGETYAILTSSEATLSARDAAVAPLQDLAKKWKAAAGELAAAEAAGPAPVDRSRLDAAESAQAAAEAAVREKAADKGCRENCRLLLQSAVDAAQREVAAARTEFGAKTKVEFQRLQDRRAAAKAAVTILPPERTATPLADRLRVPEWALDLLIAALRSIAANGLGTALIAFGAHVRSAAVDRQMSDADTSQCSSNVAHPLTAAKTEVASTHALPAPSAQYHAVRFSREMLSPSQHDTPVSALRPAYVGWCTSKGYAPFPTLEIGRELAKLFARVGIEVVDADGTKLIAGVKIKG